MLSSFSIKNVHKRLEDIITALPSSQLHCFTEGATRKMYPKFQFSQNVKILRSFRKLMKTYVQTNMLESLFTSQRENMKINTF